MLKYTILPSAVVALCLTATPSTGQISVGVQTGIGQSNNGRDPYALNTSWPTSTSGSQKTIFCDGTIASAISGNVTWEATSHFGVSLLYRSTKFTGSPNHRTIAINSWGVQVKLNFVANTRKVVPFIQAEYMFSNSNKLHQDKATSTKLPTQTQPLFDNTSNSSLGIGADLGVEIKVSQPMAFVFMVGYHGVELDAGNVSSALSALNYGAGYVAPRNIDGVFFIQTSLGIKYYFGVGKKKRDF